MVSTLIFQPTGLSVKPSKNFFKSKNVDIENCRILESTRYAVTV